MAKKLKINNSFIQQAAILAAAGIFARLLGFLYRLPLTDLIGDAGNTIYGIGYNVYTFLLVMSSAGLPAAIAKLVASRRAAGRADLAHRLFKVAFAMAVIAGLVLSVLTFIFAEQITAVFFNRPDAALALQMLTPTVFIVAIMAVIRGYFQGMANNVPTALSQVVEQIFNAVFSIILAHTLWNFALEHGYAEVNFGAAGGTLGSTVGAVAGFMFIAAIYFFFRKDILLNARNDAREAKNQNNTLIQEKTSKLIKTITITSFTIILGTAVISISNLIDLWLVPNRMAAAGFDDAAADVLFGQILGKFNPLTNLPAAISASFAVTLVGTIAFDFQQKNSEAIQSKINSSFRVGMLFTMPIAFGLAALGPQIIALLFPNHPDGGTLFMVGFPSIIFLAISQKATAVLQAIDKSRIPIFAASIGAIVKIIVVFVLVAMPSINIYGAVIGTTLCFLVTAIINCIFLFKHTGAKPDVKGIILKPTIASAGMGIAAFGLYHGIHAIFSRPTLATLAAIFAAMVIYTVLMILIKGIKEEELALLPGGKKLTNLLRRKGLL